MNQALYQKILTRVYKSFQNQQDAEDAVQSTAMNLLNLTGVEHLEAYAATAAYNHARRSYKLKAGLEWWTEATDERQDPTDYNDPHLRDVLLEGIYSLPKGQQDVIKHVLTGKSLVEMPGNYNTNKHQYLLALRLLRAYFVNKKAV